MRVILEDVKVLPLGREYLGSEGKWGDSGVRALGRMGHAGPSSTGEPGSVLCVAVVTELAVVNRGSRSLLYPDPGVLVKPAAGPLHLCSGAPAAPALSRLAFSPRPLSVLLPLLGLLLISCLWGLTWELPAGGSCARGLSVGVPVCVWVHGGGAGARVTPRGWKQAASLP